MLICVIVSMRTGSLPSRSSLTTERLVTKYQLTKQWWATILNAVTVEATSSSKLSQCRVTIAIMSHTGLCPNVLNMTSTILNYLYLTFIYVNSEKQNV